MASSPYLLRLILLSSLLLALILITTTALTPCATTRTPTTSQAVFILSRPQPVTYDFGALAPSILITVPTASHWRNDEAFHEQPANCANLLVLAGEWGLVGHGGGATICHAGYAHAQHPLRYLTWFRQDHLNPAGAMLRLDAPVQLYRTVC